MVDPDLLARDGFIVIVPKRVLQLKLISLALKIAGFGDTPFHKSSLDFEASGVLAGGILVSPRQMAGQG